MACNLLARLNVLNQSHIPGSVFTLAALLGVASGCTCSSPVALAQAITLNSAGEIDGHAGVIDRRYSQIEPTKVALPEPQIDARGHQEILRALTAEQGFAMRPIPRGKKGLTLAANGKLSPAGQGYLNEVNDKGLSVKPGDRVVLSDVRIEGDHIVFDINGGPEHKHNFLRHIAIGNGTQMSPVSQDDGKEPVGSRITLTFAKYVPEATPAQIKALLAPLISFDMKTPVQAYTDTLPPTLKDAILGHHVLVGMTTDMVLFALGQPETKSREIEGQMPFEEWIYGHPPQEVNFVRVNGNRVIRVEIARVGQPLEIFTKDEVAGLMMTDGRSVLADAADRSTHKIELGDVQRDPNSQAPAAAPSLRGPGETLPQDNSSGDRVGPMRPVIFPKNTNDDPAHTVDAHPAQQTGPAAPAGTAAPASPATTSEPAPAAQPAQAPAPPPAEEFLGTPVPAK